MFPHTRPKSLPMRSSTRAQSGVFDAVLFFLVLFTAVSTIRIVSQEPAQDVLDRQYLALSVTEMRTTVLRCTVNATSYRVDGETVVLEDKTVEELLLEDLWLRRAGAVEVESLETGIESRIDAILSNLTGMEYDYSLCAAFIPTTATPNDEHEEPVVLIGTTAPANAEVWSASGEARSPDGTIEAEITLKLWEHR